MRFSIFFAFVVVTFAACCPNFVCTENVANNVEMRRLRADAVPVPVEAVKAVVNPSSVQAVVKAGAANPGAAQAVAKAAVADPVLVRAVVNAGTRLNERLIHLRALNKVMAANGDEAAIKAGIKMVANARDSAKVSDEQAAKLVSELMIESVKKNPKSWSGLQKFAKVTMGVSAAGLATYGAYKLLTKENVAVAAPTTTTESA